jgi:hypothetical protein
MRKVVISANGPCSIQDPAPTEGNIKDLSNGTISLLGGDTKTLYLTESQFDHVIGQLERLSATRIKQVVGGVVQANTMPLATWTTDRYPGGRSRVHLMQGTLSAGSGATLALFGENLVPGVQATLAIGGLTLTAVKKGRVGNQIQAQINPASGAGSVVTKLLGDGAVQVIVTPAAASPGVAAVVSQINGDSLASVYVTASGTGTVKVPALGQLLSLSGGGGAAVAWADLASAVAGSYLRVEALRPGNVGNAINVKLLAASGAGSVATTGNAIVVTPAAASNTLTAIAAQINADASAKLLVKATVLGTGASAGKAVAVTYLAGGTGETPVVKLGGVVVNITKWTDIEIDIVATSAMLAAGGVVAAEIANVVILSDFGVIQAGSMLVAA